ncbi:hypothetical protein HK097_006193 [Rhizophlyctis rosea]|uniref:Uncharacterized protein n=1 Tax=Rhizophlyctis rosea TaxID=64517 RepID=A0AAD5SCU4_9FUNG|nr:hypothetical protein HK097_006193 [Rhizophlyctis rosea]
MTMVATYDPKQWDPKAYKNVAFNPDAWSCGAAASARPANIRPQNPQQHPCRIPPQTPSRPVAPSPQNGANEQWPRLGAHPAKQQQSPPKTPHNSVRNQKPPSAAPAAGPIASPPPKPDKKCPGSDAHAWDVSFPSAAVRLDGWDNPLPPDQYNYSETGLQLLVAPTKRTRKLKKLAEADEARFMSGLEDKKSHYQSEAYLKEAVEPRIKSAGKPPVPRVWPKSPKDPYLPAPAVPAVDENLKITPHTYYEPFEPAPKQKYETWYRGESKCKKEKWDSDKMWDWKGKACEPDWVFVKRKWPAVRVPSEKRGGGLAGAPATATAPARKEISMWDAWEMTRRIRNQG